MQVNVGMMVLIVLGLSEWFKTKLHIVDTAAEILSFAVGLILGVLYQYSVTQPVTLSDWMAVLAVGLGMALVPSGLFKLTGEIATKFNTK